MKKFRFNWMPNLPKIALPFYWLFMIFYTIGYVIYAIGYYLFRALNWLFTPIKPKRQVVRR